ncbi:MAG TPA: UDP-N-acetylglucosamine 2-epimerase [Egibacteraceae bacterium]|nr:UDP-N-acetylglucosamine 2-epimerase [Egibacteraceae bacterium]
MKRIHVFLGTKAQYIKTAPLLRLMDDQGVDYRLIDSGQHARLSVTMRADLGVRHPDYVLGGKEDVDTIGHALLWSGRLTTRLRSPARLRAEVFGGAGGVCVVHGDTPSTLLAALMARRAGLQVAHLEAGLRSHSLLNPFPEELIRLWVMRLSQLLFAPDRAALANLRSMRLRGRVIPLGGNTVIEALRHGLRAVSPPGSGPVVVTMHRVENLRNRRRVDGMIRLVLRIAESHPVRFVLHGPTVQTLARTGGDQLLREAGVELSPLLPHFVFTRLLHTAPFVITDGGSIQEECALLGVPTLLWRLRSERPDGLGGNVVLSHYEPAVVDAFLADPGRYRRDAFTPDLTPSKEILDTLLAAVDG